MKKVLFAISVAIFFFANHALAQIGKLPRPSEITRLPALNTHSQNHPLKAIQVLHKSNFFGFTGGVTSFGAGAQFGKSWMVREGFHTQLNMQMLSVREENAYSGYSLSGPSYGYNGNVMLLPFFFGVRRDLWYEQFQDAALPYIEAGVGPVVGFNFPYDYGFFGQFSHAAVALTAGAFFGAGLDYSMGKKTVGTINIRYNFIRFPGELGGRNDYSSLSILFGVSRALGQLN